MSASPMLNPWEVDAARRRAYTKEYCLAPDAGISSCSGSIVKAHSVQGALVRRIARDGHVYGSVYSIENLQRNPGEIVPGLIGVNLATTFTGFCNLHDTKIFAPIEIGDFVAAPEQCFLLAYRAVPRSVREARLFRECGGASSRRATTSPGFRQGESRSHGNWVAGPPMAQGRLRP